MNKFESNLNPIGDYFMKFSRADVNDNVKINSIKVFNSLKSELFEIKMDFSAAKAFYRFLTIGHDVIFDLPSYNVSEVCQIEIRYTDLVKMIFRFQNINDEISEIHLIISQLNYSEFCYKVFFYLLIDLISSDKDISDVNLQKGDFYE